MNPARVLADLMALPPEQRREVALRALDSLEEPLDPAREERWFAEVERRWRAIESGAEDTVDHEDALAFVFAPPHKQAV